MSSPAATVHHGRLAPCAATDAGSRGRRHSEPGPAYRSEFQRDRDRIIHSAAFRRLEYKTQVFVNHEGDLFRTRLTHSIEVAQMSRTIARALRLNEDLCEAIALAQLKTYRDKDPLNISSYALLDSTGQALLEYPHSLSYQETNFTKLSFRAMPPPLVAA